MQAKVHIVRIKERVRFTPHLIKVVLRTVDPTMAPMYLNIMKMGLKHRDDGAKKTNHQVLSYVE